MHTYRCFAALPLVLLTSLPAVLADYAQVNDGNCNCYYTNGSSANYFTSHKFFDFRSMSQYVNVPALIQSDIETSNAPSTNDYFSSASWTETWGIQQWNNSANVASGDASTFLVNSQNNVYFEKNGDAHAGSDTFLTMRTARLGDFQSAAEFESVSKTYQYLSMRMYARTLGAPGAIAAMFTYRASDTSDSRGVQESDIEIRTQDPPQYIQYTNQPSYDSAGKPVAESTSNASVAVGWNQWAVHRLDWNPKDVTWYIDGKQTARIAFQTPRDPSQIIFNCWSDGSAWVGNMTDGTEAFLQIQWIDVVYNSTGSTTATGSRKSHSRRDSGTCKNVCSIDETKKTGSPVLLSVASGKQLARVGNFGTLGSWAPFFATALILLAL